MGDGVRERSVSEVPKLDSERGFLPLQDPLTRLPQPFDEWENVAMGLPKLLASGYFRRMIEHLPPFPIETIGNDRERDRAMALLSYLGHAYVWGEDNPAQVLPKRLATALAERRKESRPATCTQLQQLRIAQFLPV